MSGLTGTGGASMFWAQSTADMLGLEVGFCEQVHTGGCSAAGAVARAAAAIDAGMCEVALCLFADTHVREHNGRNDRNYRRDWTDPYGLLGPPGAFGLLQRAYDAKYGVDLRVLGKLAVTQRNHAIMNENACEELRVPITVEDYLNSRMIADPIRLLDCVMLADGAAGLIVTSKKRAKEKGLNKYVIPIGYAERTNFLGGENLVDVTRSGHEIAGKKALGRRRLEHQGRPLVPPLRRLPDRAGDPVRGVRLLQAGRGHGVRPRHRPLVQRHAADEHRRRPDLGRPGGLLVAQPDRGGAATDGRSRQAPGQGHHQRARHRHRLDQLRTQLGLERGAGAGPEPIVEDIMAVTLNDTLGVKRDIKHYDFGMPFWEATRQKKLVIQYCKTAKKFQHFPRPVSIFTGRRRDIEWREVSGKGKVFSYTIAHRGTPAFQGAEPYAIASVTLDDGVNVIADMVNCTAEELKVGMKVKPYWHPLDNGEHLLMWQPDKDAK